MIKRPTYDDYDEYIIDYHTTNSSFIMLASILRRKGIKNYNFFLKLYDADLIDVNPYDPNLSSQMKFKIIMECRRNFWYFIREIFCIPSPGGAQRYILNRGNLALSWCCLNNIPVMEVMPRQHGKTWGVIAYALWVFNFATEYTNMLFMNKALSDSELNLARLKQARELLPDYLRNDKMQTAKGEFRDAPSNVTKISNALHNEIVAKASARNPTSADELGRGMTVAWVWIDEVAFLQFNRIIYAAMAPAWSKAAEVATSKNKPIGKILTTTPSDLSTDMGKFAHEIKEQAAQFSEKLYDMDSDDVNTWIDKNTKIGYIYVEFGYQQLHHVNPSPEEWFANQCKELLYDWAKIRREILLQWTNASTNSPFDQDDLRDLRSMVITPSDNDSITINKYYKLNVYKKLDISKKYIITCDPAKGHAEQADRTAITVIDAKTDECCAIFKSPTIQYKETFRFIHTLFYNYIPQSVIVIENNIDTLIEYVKNSTMRYALYYEPTKDPTKEVREKGVVKNKRTSNIIYGINTNAQNRPKYFDLLFEMVRNEKEKICCEELVDEIESLEYKTDTRIEATSGSHDDIIFSYLIGLYVKRMGSNRSRFGLFYADNIDDTKPKIADPYKVNRIFQAAPKGKDEDSKYSSPFWNDLLEDMDVAIRLAEKEEKSGGKKKFFGKGIDEEDIGIQYTDNIFTGERDPGGLSRVAISAFENLNSREKVDYYDEYARVTKVDDTDDSDLLGWF